MTSIRNKPEYIFPEVINKPDYVKSNFNEIAGNYDRFNDWITLGMHRIWKKRTVQAVLPLDERRVRILDLCCGSGDLTLRLADLLPPGSDVIAADFSSEMLRILQKRIDKHGPTTVRIERQETDVTRLDRFSENTLDGAVIGFGLRNVLERTTCLREIRRVLRPGAVLAILDVGRVPYPLLSGLHRFYFDKIVPRIGYFVHGRPHEMYAYLPASARKYPDQDRLKDELFEAGFSDVRYQRFMLGAAVLHRAVK